MRNPVEQARKLQAMLEVWNCPHSLTHLLTGVKCWATSVAKKWYIWKMTPPSRRLKCQAHTWQAMKISLSHVWLLTCVTYLKNDTQMTQPILRHNLASDESEFYCLEVNLQRSKSLTLWILDVVNPKDGVLNVSQTEKMLQCYEIILNHLRHY